MQRTIMSQRQRMSDQQARMRRFRSDLDECVQHIQEPQKLRQSNCMEICVQIKVCMQMHGILLRFACKHMGFLIWVWASLRFDRRGALPAVRAARPRGGQDRPRRSQDGAKTVQDVLETLSGRTLRWRWLPRGLRYDSRPMFTSTWCQHRPRYHPKNMPIVFHCFWIVFHDFHSFSLFFNGFHWFSMVFNVFLCFSLFFICFSLCFSMFSIPHFLPHEKYRKNNWKTRKK